MVNIKKKDISVLFINPIWALKGGVWKDVAACMPSLGLGYVASYLRKNCKKRLKIQIIDMVAEQMTISDLTKRISCLNFDYIGITSTTITIKSALKIAEECKNLNPHTKIIFGGVHPSISPDEVLSNSAVDFVIRNEGEISLLELVSGKFPSTINNLSYRKNGKIIHNPERELIKNLDDIPMPAYDLMPMDKYFPAVGSYKRLPAVSVIATRGCPGRCTFCYKVFGTTLRTRSAKNIFNEIKYLKQKFGIKEIAFYDDTFTSFRQNVKAFCKLLIKSKMNITWSCFSRVDCIDGETLKLMKKAGCHQILYGVESADHQILQNIDKRINLEKVKQAVAMTKKAGISARCSFMLGNPGETKETIERTIDFAIDLDPDLAMFNITVPFPGTRMYSWAKEHNYLLTEDWDDYDLSKQIMKLPTISNEDLQYYYALAYKKFFLRPKYILKRFFKIRSIEDAKELMNGASAVINVVKSKFKASKKPLGSSV